MFTFVTLSVSCVFYNPIPRKSLEKFGIYLDLDSSSNVHCCIFERCICRTFHNYHRMTDVRHIFCRLFKSGIEVYDMYLYDCRQV